MHSRLQPSLKHSLSVDPSSQDCCSVAETVAILASKGKIKERGAIYTKREVVDFILDLIGYTDEQPLLDFCLLDPSLGDGNFIIPALERLLISAQRAQNGFTFSKLAPAIRGVELHRETFERSRSVILSTMIEQGVNRHDAHALVDTWLFQEDFLLCEFDQDFTYVVGNPPYVRQETIPAALITEYRSRYSTIYDRADLYVPFFEKSLKLLKQNGKLGFICSDRWMKNRYGKKLRELISKSYKLLTYVDMFGADAFHTKVSAYPSITVIERSTSFQAPTATRIFTRPEISKEHLTQIARELTAKTISSKSSVKEISNIAVGSEPWILENFDALFLVRRIEANFPRLEQAGCKVGIGVATGADTAFIGDFEDLDVEPCRKLPLIMPKDIREGHVIWQGKGVINPFDNGKLVDLQDFPRLKKYLEARYEQIASRYVATKSPQNWYRTIDCINPTLANREKLLIPDIKGDASIVYESGNFYPHHNLYYITSDEWDVHALQAIMQSGIARLFVSLYSPRIRGGYLRFQAQYLRRICVPKWESVSQKMRKHLKKISKNHSQGELNEIVVELYKLSSSEIKLIEGENTK